MSTLGFPPAYFLDRPGAFFDRFGVAGVPAGSTATVVSVLVPARMVCVLMELGIDGGQLTNWVWGTWTLWVGGLPDPEFQSVNGMISRILNPIAVYRRIDPGLLIELRVTNTNASQSFQYQGRLVGFFQSEDKLYGQVADQATDLRG